MTDEQIIQAVGLCANAQEDCRKCPLHSMYSANCIKKLMNITLDLIKRQQEMIEAIINGQETLSKALVTKDAEIERLTDLNKVLERDVFNAEMNLDLVTQHYDEYRKAEAQIKFSKKKIELEAIKNFTDKLYERAYVSTDWSHGTHPMVVEWNDIEEVIEEMTEVDDEQGKIG